MLGIEDAAEMPSLVSAWTGVGWPAVNTTKKLEIRSLLGSLKACGQCTVLSC